MNKLYRLEDSIKVILEIDSKAREDDMYLYTEYIKAVTKEDIVNMPLIFESNDYRKDLGILSFKSVERCRRKLQAMYPYLNPRKEVKDQRENQQMEFFRYATDYENTFIKMVDSK